MSIIKKALSVLLIFCFALSVGCGTGEESSSPVSSAASETASELSQEVSAPPADATEYVNKINGLLSDHSDRTLSSQNLLRGLSYLVSRNTHADYPDTGKLLTDGGEPGSFNKTEWAGYLSSKHEPLTVEFDLGAVKTNLLDFHADALNLISYGIGAPDKMVVSIALEDKEFTEVGTAYCPLDIGDEAWDFSVMLAGSVDARYVRFEFSGQSLVWLFIGEVTAVAYGDEYKNQPQDGYVNPDIYYGFDKIPEISTPVYWDKNESNYGTTRNLVSGLTPMIFAGLDIQADLAVENYNSKNTNWLTDGKTATRTSMTDPAWFRITRGENREIVFDLQKTSAVSGFSAGFLLEASTGVHLPGALSVKLSENGVDWQTVFTQKTVTSTKKDDIVRVEESFKRTYKARYVMVSFAVNGHCYCDEITVSGKLDASSATAVVPDTEGKNPFYKNEYISPEDFLGVNNMLLSYNCLRSDSGSHEESGLITAEEYLPYVAYLDADGKIKDTLFDAFLYLPYTRFNYSDYGRSANGWRFYVDDVFSADRNVAALDACVETVKTALNLKDYKAKVFFSALYTFKTTDSGAVNNFGDIDGDGINEDFNNIADRKKCIKWLIDEQYSRFKAGGYENLELKGIYWFEEAIAYSDPHEPELIKYAADYAHSLGLKLFWIPYQQASGYADWETLGFDLACMQPNYMFRDNATSDILYTNAELTKKYGMCVEMEINDPTNRRDASRFTEYMIAGAKTGYMNAVKIYYQSGVPGAFHTACNSNSAAVRKLYDDLYLFAKEKYVVPDVSDLVISDNAIEFSGTGEINGLVDISAILGGKLRLSSSPKYGSVRLNLDGSFFYYAHEGFTGVDEFEIYADFGYGTSKPCTVKITIS